MAWKSDGNGPWGGGSGGSGGQGPFGGGGQPPDVEEMLRRSQEKFKSFMPAGGGGIKGFILVILAAAVLWLGSGMYRIQPGEVGVVMLFGKFVKSTAPGLNYWIPGPIGDVIKLPVTQINTINIGFVGSSSSGSSVGTRDVPQESLMLTGDQNIVDIDFVVQWKIKDAAEFLFNIRDPETTIKVAAESSMREVVGQKNLEPVLTTDRQQIQEETKRLLQDILDSYGAGVSVEQVQLQNADPPREVIDAFNDVQRAKQDQERAVNEAIAYQNDIVPRARGESEKMIQAASAYKERVTKEAEGEAARFISVYDTYKNAKEVTRLRLYLERMQDILQGANKVIIEQSSGGSGVVPYLPLNELMKGSNQ